MSTIRRIKRDILKANGVPAKHCKLFKVAMVVQVFKRTDGRHSKK
ncbi:hypothetical protein LCGC14_2770430 [marine sediment metagenome]|uniref:Uncharacterized protein n=1 Tax=marine sediment metagenome TaxID=412755 RepID=A0A0F8ZI44_9ZZZZ